MENLVTSEDAKNWIESNREEINHLLEEAQSAINDFPDQSNYNADQETLDWSDEQRHEIFETLRKLSEAYDLISMEKVNQNEGSFDQSFQREF